MQSSHEWLSLVHRYTLNATKYVQQKVPIFKESPKIFPPINSIVFDLGTHSSITSRHRMPRKRPRNPLKRAQVEYVFFFFLLFVKSTKLTRYSYDQGPNSFITKKSRNPNRPQKSEEYGEDDTPKAFKRLMIWSEKLQGLRPFDKDKRAAAEAEAKKKGNKKDSAAGGAAAGGGEKKKGKQLPKLTDVVPAKKVDTSDLKIKPGESMADFSRRVNEALPVGRGKDEGPSRGALRAQKKRARVEKELAAARQKKIERGEIDDDEEDEDVRWNQRGTTRNKAGKRETSPDPWARLQKPAPKFGDVVDRPPELNLSGKILNNVPKKAGSLAKRHMLESERQRFIDGYRALMESKRGDGEDN